MSATNSNCFFFFFLLNLQLLIYEAYTIGTVKFPSCVAGTNDLNSCSRSALFCHCIWHFHPCFGSYQKEKKLVYKLLVVQVLLILQPNIATHWKSHSSVSRLSAGVHFAISYLYPGSGFRSIFFCFLLGSCEMSRAKAYHNLDLPSTYEFCLPLPDIY